MVAAGPAQQPPGSGGGRRAGLLLPGHGDGPLAVAGVHVGGDLGAREGQHAIVGQRAGDGSLVHVGGQAVPAVEFPGDVAVVVLRGSGESGGGKVCQKLPVPPFVHFPWSTRSTITLAYGDTALPGLLGTPMLGLILQLCPPDTCEAARAEHSSRE